MAIRNGVEHMVYCCMCMHVCMHVCGLLLKFACVRVFVSLFVHIQIWSAVYVSVLSFTSFTYSPTLDVHTCACFNAALGGGGLCGCV